MNKNNSLLIGGLGLALVYIAYLLQNSALGGLEGFQDPPPMPPPAPMQEMPPAPPPMPAPAPMPPAPAPMPPQMPPPMPPQIPPPMPPMPPQETPMQGVTPGTPPNQQQLMDMSRKLTAVCAQVNTLDSISQQMQQMSQAQPPVREGFQSSYNPYNSPSPSMAQAYEFRLGKKSLTNEVISWMSS